MSLHLGPSLPADRGDQIVVLVADDEPQIRNLVSAVLRSQGWAVLSVANAAGALRLSRNRALRIDILVTDVDLGEGMDGLALAERMRRERANLGVLIVSGTPQWSVVAAGKGLPFLAKPFTLPALTERVHEALAPVLANPAGEPAALRGAGIRSAGAERRRVEVELLSRLQQAAEAYRNAAVRARVLLEYAQDLGSESPDGAHAMHEASASEGLALEKCHFALHELSAALRANGKRPRRDWLGSLLDTAVDAARASKGIIQVLDPAEHVLTIAAQHGFDQPFLGFFRRVQEGAAASGRAFQTGRRVVVEDVSESPVFRGPAQSALLEAHVRAVTSTPLTGPAGNPVGVLSTHYSEPTQPTRRDLELMDSFAHEVAVLLARLQRD